MNTRGPGCPGNHIRESNVVETQQDFQQIAERALNAGIFAVDATAAAEISEGFALPTRLLESPYGNGPAQIERYGVDVPVETMDRVRRNIVKANRILLDHRSLLGYFHDRFTSDDVFDSEGIRQAADRYSPIVLGFAARHIDKSASFVTEGVDRKATDRRLFTQSELEAGMELGREQPELLMTIFGYQGVVIDYIEGVKDAFVAMPEGVDEQGLEDLERFSAQWRVDNFTIELLPAMAIFLAQARQAHPEVETSTLINQELFSNAVSFIISNGAFRNFVNVPASVAADGKERVNHFVCPAAGTIRQHLSDGWLLNTIYRVTDSQLRAGNQPALRLHDQIKGKFDKVTEDEQRRKLVALERAAEAAKPVIEIDTEGRDLQSISAEAIGRVFRKNKPASFTFEDTDYFVTPESLKGLEEEKQTQQTGDIELYIHAGEHIYGAFRRAIATALEEKKSVFFSFNGRDHRIDIEKLDDIIQASSTGQADL